LAAAACGRRLTLVRPCQVKKPSIAVMGLAAQAAPDDVTSHCVTNKAGCRRLLPCPLFADRRPRTFPNGRIATGAMLKRLECRHDRRARRRDRCGKKTPLHSLAFHLERPPFLFLIP